MPPLALALVLIAACTHATWNLLAKQAAGSRHFVWLYSVMSVVIWSPVVLFLPWPAPELRVGLGLLGTGLLHLAYATALQMSYRAADLSVVYPLVRGTGPLLAFIGAIVLLGEPLTVLGAGGAFLVVTGVFLLAGGRSPGRALPYGLGTGALVASYTVWDGYLVKVLGITPLLVDFAGNVLRMLVLLPWVWRERGSLPAELRQVWRAALGVAVLGPLGYTLVLYAMTLAPVGHVAPARELSMLVAAWLGARVLGEGHTRRRMVASVVIVAGVVLLALAG